MDNIQLVDDPLKKTKYISKHSDGFGKTNIQSHPGNKASMIGELDGSCDFSGGCTPYKHIAKNAANKQKMANDKKRRCKHKPAKPDLTATKDEMLTDNSNMQKDTDNVCNEVESGMKTCKICRQLMPSVTYKGHLTDCLKKHFNKSTKSSEEGSAVTDTETSSDLVKYDNCQAESSGLSSVERNTCTKMRTEAKSQSEGSSKHVNEETSKLDCNICGQNLEYLTSQRRAQHLNRCLDKMSEKAKKEERVKEMIVNKVLDCPLCGQALKTSRSRQIHLKRCAKKLEVSVPVLYKCIQQQEEEYKLKLDAGVLPEEGKRNNRRHKQHRRNRAEQRTSSTSSVRLEEPESKLDEETQLALALSESLRDDKELLTSIAKIPGMALHEVASDSVTKDAFSVLMTPKLDSGAPRKKTRKRALLKTTYQLETETAENRISKLEHKIGLLLSAQGMTDICPTPSIEASSLARKLHSTEFGWWFISSQPNGEKKLYYVKELQPQIMPTDVDISRKLLKTANNLGEKTQKAPDSSTLQVRSDGMPFSSLDSSSNNTLVASTQTVVLLAEMASDTTELDVATDSTPASQDHSNNKTVQFTLPQCKQQNDDCIEDYGFAVPEEFKKQQMLANDKLIKDMMSLLISEQNADITIICSNDTTVRAHSLIIQTRCPPLLKDLSSGQIMLQQYSKACIQTMLRYIYTADLSVPEYLTAELGDLAKRYNLVELGTACSDTQFLKNTLAADEIKYEDKAIQSHDLIDKTLQNLLHDAWGSDSEDEGEEQHSVVDKNDSKLSHRIDQELELDELYQLVVSQKHKSPSESEAEMGADGSGSHDTNEDVRSMSDTGSTALNVALLKKLDHSFMSESTVFSQTDMVSVSPMEEQDVHLNITNPTDNFASSDEEDVSTSQGKQVAHTPVNLFRSRASNETTPDLFDADDTDIHISDSGDHGVDISDAGPADMDDNGANVSRAGNSAVGDGVLCLNGIDVGGFGNDTANKSSNCSLKESYRSSPGKHLGSDDNHLVHHKENITNVNGFNTEGELTQNCTHVSSQHTPKENESSSQYSNHSNSHHCEAWHKRKRTSPSHHSNNIQTDIHISKRIRMETDHTKTDERSPCSSPVWKSKINSVLEDEENVVDLTKEDDQKETHLTHESHLSLCGRLKPMEKQQVQDLAEEQNVSEADYVAGSPISMKELSSPSVKTVGNLSDGSDDNNDEKHGDPEQGSYSTMDTWDDFDDAGGYNQFDEPFTQIPHEEDSAADEVSSISSSKTATCNQDTDNDTETLLDRSSLRHADIESTLARQSLETRPSQLVLNEGSSNLNKTPEYLGSPFKTPTQMSPLKCSGRRQVSSPILVDLDSDGADIEQWNEDLPSDGTGFPVKTPVKQQTRKCWVPPSPFTPMSDYDNMSTPELKKACHKVGVKPLPKKKMIAILKDIYHKTHTYETDTDYEGTPCRPSITNPSVIDPCTKSKPNKSSKRDVIRKSEEEDSMNSSQEVNSSCSQDSSGTCSDLPEESMLIVDDEEPKQTMSKTDISYKRQCIWDFIKADKDLYMKILHYEPLDITSFHHQLKSSGFNIGIRIVMDFLDDQNVLFTLKNQPTNRRKKKVSRKGLTASQTRTHH